MADQPQSQARAIPGSGTVKKKKKIVTADGGGTKKAKSGAITEPVFQPTDRPSLPVLTSLNLAVRPDLEAKSPTGVKLLKKNTTVPHHQSDLNNESHLHFIIRSSRNEWIRFESDALSLVIYGTYNNPDRVLPAAAAAFAAATPERRAEKHALRASDGLPQIYIDPSIMGTAFFYKVDVLINNVSVPTNACLGNLMLHYTRCCRVFNDKPGPVFYNTNQVAFGANRNGLNRVMRAATQPFDYISWDRTVGTRVPVYLDGHFPFDCRNRTLESIEGKKEPNLYFPPDTEIEIRFHLFRDRGDAVFNHLTNNVTNFDDNVASYWNTGQAAAWQAGFSLSIQSAELEYESCELHADGHEKSLQLFRSGGIATYYYDIPRGQHQTLTAGQSFTDNIFQVMPWARLVYILFLPDWATYPMENMRRPLSAFSRYPLNATDTQIGFAGQNGLVVDKFVNFGVPGDTAHISKKIYYNYLKGLKAFAGDLEDLFPRYTTERSLVQGYIFDLKDYMSANTEYLNIKMNFSGVNAAASPERTQIVIFTVHTNGKATCKQAQNPFSYVWNFTQY